MTNKKIINAEAESLGNIKFKSRLEASCYKKLVESGLDFSYEGEKCVILEGFRPERTVIYRPLTKGGRLEKELSLDNRKIQNVTYTPDFVVNYGDVVAYFDVKGFPNDTYPIKRKMFMSTLENRNDNKRYFFFEPHSVKQFIQALEILKSYDKKES